MRHQDINTAKDFANAIGTPVLTSDTQKIHGATRRAHSLGVTEGMAECMEMFRSDMIKAGVIDESVPPMFMTEAILGAIQRAVLKERNACAHICDLLDSEVDKYPAACASAIRARSAS